MNENLESPDDIQPPVHKAEKRISKITRATIPLDTVLYNEIEALLPELSNEIGAKIIMSMFLRKTIVENWKVQLERYRKLNPTAKRSSF